MSNYKGPYNSFSQNAEPIYSQSNILGTVSQSGGVPTGAIIERGSNANGEFVKYADGTLICSTNVVISYNTTSFQVFDLPHSSISSTLGRFSHSFSFTSNVFENYQRWAYVSVGSHQGTSVDFSQVRFLFRPSGSTMGTTDATETIRVRSIGRWY